MFKYYLELDLVVKRIVRKTICWYYMLYLLIELGKEINFTGFYVHYTYSNFAWVN